MCVCVLCCHPIYSGRQVCERSSRGHIEGRSHRISPPSFCGAYCLNFSREKDSAIPFPRRPWSRFLCTIDLIVLPLLGIYIYLVYFMRQNPSSCEDTEIRTHIPTSEGFEVTNWTTGATGQRYDIIIGEERYIYVLQQVPRDFLPCHLTAEPVSRDQILRHARGQGNINFPWSANHEHDWQPYPVDPCCYMWWPYLHTYIQNWHMFVLHTTCLKMCLKKNLNASRPSEHPSTPLNQGKHVVFKEKFERI